MEWCLRNYEENYPRWKLLFSNNGFSFLFGFYKGHSMSKILSNA